MSSTNATIAASNGTADAQSTHAPAGGYNLAIGYLRAFVTLLVVAHHAVIAYCPFLPPAAPASLLTQPRWWQAFPVIDPHRFVGFGLFVGFNDMFFMSLMFLLSGLFVWTSLRRKGGAGTFTRDRLLRLGLPFVVAAAIIAPLAYYPTYLQTGGHGVAGFWQIWKSLGTWPAGPAWFVWVLLMFDVIVAALFAIRPNFGEALGKLAASGEQRPFRVFTMLVAVSAVAYVPLSLLIDPLYWSSFGPFFFQTSRIVHYFVYFLAGIAVGAYGLDRGLLAAAGQLARRWGRWTLGAIVAFAFAIAVFGFAISATTMIPLWKIYGGLAFVLSCAASSFACMAVFVHFTCRQSSVWDSLTRNAYGIYLVHYAFVSWLQFALLKFNWPGLVKGLAVTAAAVLLSWATTAALRRIPAIARVI
jgi:peptidoglycan/LPS O-acetylase OafA/YrhL